MNYRVHTVQLKTFKVRSGGCLCDVVFVFHQIAAVVESVPEVKPVAAADCGPTGITESTAKPPPFKDPAFMVSGRLGF